MNKNVIKILSILIQKMLNDEEVWENYDEIVKELEDDGYTIENISEAYDLVFSEIISVQDHEFYIDSEMKSGYNRAFTQVENFYFSSEIKTIIYKLNSLAVLKAEELEIIIFRMMQLAVYNELKKDLVWEIINDVIDDRDLLFMISSEINEFDSNLLKEYRVN